MEKNWSTLSPYLKSAGYCVFALNYGETNGVYATAPVAKSAQELAPFVDAVRSATDAKEVDLVGHSQGGMMPRYYMGFLGGAKYVHHLIGIAPSNHGTEGLIVPPPGVVPDPDYTGLG
jgi:triacylglycerol lipase